jgi:hypothetical protein
MAPMVIALVGLWRGDDEPHLPVAHHEVPALPHNAVTEFLENPHSVPLVDVRKPRHFRS